MKIKITKNDLYDFLKSVGISIPLQIEGYWSLINLIANNENTNNMNFLSIIQIIAIIIIFIVFIKVYSKQNRRIKYLTVLLFIRTKETDAPTDFISEFKEKPFYAMKSDEDKENWYNNKSNRNISYEIDCVAKFISENSNNEDLSLLSLKKEVKTLYSELNLIEQHEPH